jgi:hypothetical protein
MCVNHSWWWQKTAETCSSCECSINKIVLRLNRIWPKFVKYKICLTQYCFVTHNIRADLLTGGMEGSCHVFGQKFTLSTEKDRTEFLHVLSSQNSVAALYFETSSVYSEDGIVFSLRNFGKFLLDITTSYLRRLWIYYSPPWAPQISGVIVSVASPWKQ